MRIKALVLLEGFWFPKEFRDWCINSYIFINAAEGSRSSLDELRALRDFGSFRDVKAALNNSTLSIGIYVFQYCVPENLINTKIYNDMSIDKMLKYGDNSKWS